MIVLGFFAFVFVYSRKIVTLEIENKGVLNRIFQKLLKQNRDKLKCFNKNIDIGLATTLFETVSQFKSCKIDFNEVSIKNQNKILQDKLDDIALIYGSYQKYLKEM